MSSPRTLYTRENSSVTNLLAGLSELPVETVELIISYVTSDPLQYIDELCRLARVSKFFRELVEPLLYTSLTVNNTDSFYALHLRLMKADRRLRGYVRELHLRDIDSKWARSFWRESTVQFLRGFVLDVLDGCPSLSRLAITGGDISTGHTFFRENFTLHPGHRHITHLRISNTGGDAATPSLVALVCKWPALQILELPVFTGEPQWRQAYHLDRHARPASPQVLSPVLPQKSSGIRYLYFQSPQGLDNLSLTSMLLMPRRLEHLSLCAAFWPEVLEEVFDQIGSSLLSLRLNTSRYLPYLFDDHITIALEKCTGLTCLHLDNSLFRDEHVRVLPATLEYLTLTYLDPSKCTLEPLREAICDPLRFPKLERLEAHKLLTFPPVNLFENDSVELLRMTCEERGVEPAGDLFDLTITTPGPHSPVLFDEPPVFSGSSFANGVVLP